MKHLNSSWETRRYPRPKRNELTRLARRAAELTPEGALDVLHEEVGAVFGRVLENAGVFKWDEAGRAAQRRFLDSL